jgi:hypothetical protein
MTNTIKYSGKVFLAPNTSDNEIVEKAFRVLEDNGINKQDVQLSYNIQELDKGDLYVTYDPPDLVVRNVYEKKLNGIVKMKSCAVIKLELE